jgi:hypothetical protein
MLDVELQTIHDRITQMTLELVPVKSFAMILSFKIRRHHTRQKCEEIFRRNKLLSLETKVSEVGCLLYLEF